jgi:hypothetical protein
MRRKLLGLPFSQCFHQGYYDQPQSTPQSSKHREKHKYTINYVLIRAAIPNISRSTDSCKHQWDFRKWIQSAPHYTTAHTVASVTMSKLYKWLFKKLKLSHYTPRRRLGERRYSSYSFSTSALNGGELSASRPDRPLAPGPGGPQSKSGHRGQRKNHFASAGDRTSIARSSSS